MDTTLPPKPKTICLKVEEVRNFPPAFRFKNVSFLPDPSIAKALASALLKYTLQQKREDLSPMMETPSFSQLRNCYQDYLESAHLFLQNEPALLQGYSLTENLSFEERLLCFASYRSARASKALLQQSKSASFETIQAMKQAVEVCQADFMSLYEQIFPILSKGQV